MTGGKLIHPSLENTERHYVEHKERSFYPSLLDYFTSGPVFAMVWEGESVVKGGRQLIGKTNPLEAQLGTIRGRCLAYCVISVYVLVYVYVHIICVLMRLLPVLPSSFCLAFLHIHAHRNTDTTNFPPHMHTFIPTCPNS